MENDIPREQFEKFLKWIGSPSKCKGCGKEIYWVTSKHSGEMPITKDCLNHFHDCPDAKKFRNKDRFGKGRSVRAR